MHILARLFQSMKMEYHSMYLQLLSVQLSSVAQSCPTVCNPMNHSTPGLPVHPRVHSNSFPLSRWCHPAISSSVVLFSSCPQSLAASGSFPMSQLFARGGQSIGVSDSASVLYHINFLLWFLPLYVNTQRIFIHWLYFSSSTLLNMSFYPACWAPLFLISSQFLIILSTTISVLLRSRFSLCLWLSAIWQCLIVVLCVYIT